MTSFFDISTSTGSAYDINLYQRPGANNPAITEQIVDITTELTGEWFTPDVPDATRKDLRFQDALCLEIGGKVAAFIMFTSCDGAINLSLVGARPGACGNGYGSRLMESMIEFTRQIGFDRIEVLTVPPEEKACYQSTVAFYLKHGFVIEKTIAGLWESSSALKLVKKLAM